MVLAALAPHFETGTRPEKKPVAHGNKTGDGRSAASMAGWAVRRVTAAVPSSDTGRWICNSDPERTAFTAAVTMAGRNNGTPQVKCPVCKPARKFGMAHFTRVDAPPSLASHFLLPTAAQKQKQTQA